MPALKVITCYLRKIASQDRRGFIRIVPIFVSALVVIWPTAIYAQQPNLTIAVTYTTPKDAKVANGDIVSLNPNGQIIPSNKAYDQSMLGVVVDPASIVYRTSAGGIPVVRYNEAFVNVTTLNGPIEKGDYITTSTIAGKGQKATKVGSYALGIALESFNEDSGNPLTVAGEQVRLGQIMVKIQIGPTIGSTFPQGGILGLLAQLGFSFLNMFKEPQTGTALIRYMTAGIIAIVAITFSFATFGRNITQGIESIGRNPLAKISIQSSIIINAIVIAIVSIGGILLSLAMLRF